MKQYHLLMLRQPPRSSLYPYTPLYRSTLGRRLLRLRARGAPVPSRHDARRSLLDAPTRRGRALRPARRRTVPGALRSEEHTSVILTRQFIVFSLLLGNSVSSSIIYSNT